MIQALLKKRLSVLKKHREYERWVRVTGLKNGNGASGSIFNSVATIDTYVYNALRSSTPIGMTSAATFFQSVACCITILVANAIVKKIDKDSAII